MHDDRIQSVTSAIFLSWKRIAIWSRFELSPNDCTVLIFLGTFYFRDYSLSPLLIYYHVFFMNYLQNLSPFFCLTTENNGYHSIFVKCALRKSSELLFCFDLNNTSISWISFPFLIFISTSTFFLFYLGTLAFGNSVYLLLNVGFIQMLKSFTPVIIMVTAYLTRIENPSR